MSEDNSTFERDPERWVTTYSVAVDVEFLPGKQLSFVNLSLDFAHRELAELSLDHVREQFPHAYIKTSQMMRDAIDEGWSLRSCEWEREQLGLH